VRALLSFEEGGCCFRCSAVAEPQAVQVSLSFLTSRELRDEVMAGKQERSRAEPPASSSAIRAQGGPRVRVLTSSMLTEIW
jgi:hypothetical protein